MSEELFTLPVPFATYVVLRQFLVKHGVTQELHQVVDQAISDWMSSLEAARREVTSSTLSGYQWKHLFLPDGTKLRTVRNGSHHVAHVVDCKVQYEGKSCTPAQFVNEIHGSCRNAWKTLWILRPKEAEWKLANEYRGIQPAIRARIRVAKNNKRD